MNELSLYILDIVQNSFKANSKNVCLIINEDKETNLLSIEVDDDGVGMSEETIKKALSPFYTTRTTRKVGLGLPLFKELCELCEGSLNITSVVGEGTKLLATFKLDSIDLPPMGDLKDTLYLLIINKDDVDIKFTHLKNNKEYSFDTIEIKKILDGVSISDPLIMSWFKDMIIEEEAKLNN